MSIITNAEKNQNEYKDLKLLWNSCNAKIAEYEFEDLTKFLQYKNMEMLEDLVDYKSLNHESFLSQINELFYLKMKIEKLKKICEEHDNYIFVSDNFIKMVRILLNIEAKIPVILMGETGVGKTKLLEMLSILYGKGNSNWKPFPIHPGITDKDIVKFIKDIEDKLKDDKNLKKDETIWVFFDEINTCNSLGLLSEIICNHTCLGKKISENIIFLGACNPYRELTKKMKESGLVYYNSEKITRVNNLVYSVNILPHSLLNFVFDFGSLKKEDENKYISSAIESMISSLKKKKIIEISEDNLNILQSQIIESIIICHDFISEKYDRSSISLREIKRFGIFFEYFINYFKNKTFEGLRTSMNMTLYLSYYLRLNDKNHRNELVHKLNESKIFEDFLNIPLKEVKSLTSQMKIEKGIALNRALKENLFTSYICIDNVIPLIIVGKPGTGKSLSLQILFNTLQGEYSENPIFRKKGKLYRYYYQGSEASTSQGIEEVFKKALMAKEQDKEKKRINLVFFDEMGLAERSNNNPLKIMHYLLEQERDKSVPFLGISNWRLDAAKINRALNLSITDYDLEDLEETAISIAKALDEFLSSSFEGFFRTLAKTYYEYINLDTNKNFHGNRDFYHLIKTAMYDLMSKGEELQKNEKRILTEIGLFNLRRNFGGLSDSTSKIEEVFKNIYGYKYDDNFGKDNQFSVIDVIKKNLSNPNSRYLMLISEENDGSDIAKYLIKKLNKNYIELIGSKYKRDLSSGRYIEEVLNKIKYIIGTETILILKDLNKIYPSLYDLFNQNFILFGDKKTVRIAFEYTKISSEVNKDFHAIVIVNEKQIEKLKLDPPFINRFEKHIINFNMLLDKKDNEIVENINKYFFLISCFNNNKELKYDLGKLLINCRPHNIEGLVFKTKQDIENNKILNKKHLEKGKTYEEIIIKETFKKIVPTLCQDIIVAIVKLDLPQKQFNNMILELYKEKKYNNFESFFKNISKRKNIIYTLSKVTEDIFIDKITIKNKFGTFTHQLTEYEMVESIKSENDLVSLIKNFTDSNKNLLIFRFTDSVLNKMDYINFIISNYEKDNKELSKKVIIFLVHKRRFLKNEKVHNEKSYETISFIDDEYYQIFIDNLHGKDNLDLLNIIQKNNDELANEYIYNTKFIETNIYRILNFLNCQILNETEDFNSTNYMPKLYEKIVNNK